MLQRPYSDVLAYLSAYQTHNGGVSPSMDEIAESIGVSSKSHITRILNVLEAYGHIKRLKHRARAIEITPRPARVKWFAFDDETKELVERKDIR